MKSQETICSIVAIDANQGLSGVATASSSLAVGKSVPFTGARAGAMAVQGFTSPYFGIAGMKLLREGKRAEEVLEAILADDPIRESRQILLADAAGKTAAFTGAALPEFCGSVEGENFIIGGCGLSGRELLEECAEAFEKAPGGFAQRLVEAIMGVAESKSNRAPVESAALRISKDDPFPYVDLRVDMHNQPVKELSRLLALWREKNGPLAAGARS